ncbi:MAG: hypothetical protein ACTSQP_14245 [Promethearchaeota archaeon]
MSKRLIKLNEDLNFLKERVKILNERGLKGIEVWCISIQEGERVTNKIMFRDPNTEKEGFIHCIHTGINNIKLEDALTMEPKKMYKKIIENSKNQQYYKKFESELSLSDHFSSLKSYICGIIEYGIGKVLIDSFKDGELLSLSLTGPMIIQFIEALKKVRPIFINEIQARFLEYLYKSYKNSFHGIELADKKFDIYTCYGLCHYGIIDDEHYKLCIELFPTHKHEINLICLTNPHLSFNIKREIINNLSKIGKKLNEIIENVYFKDSSDYNEFYYKLYHQIIFKKNNLPLMKYFKILLASSNLIHKDFLEILAKDKSSLVRAAIASNISTPLNVLKQLSYDKSLMVISNLLKNRKITNDIFNKIFERNSLVIRKLLIKNKRTPTYILENIIKSEEKLSNEILRQIITHPNAPPEFLRNVFENNKKNLEILILLASNKNTPQDILSRLYKYNNTKIKIALSLNPNLSDHLIHNFIDTMDKEILINLMRTGSLNKNHYELIYYNSKNKHIKQLSNLFLITMFIKPETKSI